MPKKLFIKKVEKTRPSIIWDNAIRLICFGLALPIIGLILIFHNGGLWWVPILGILSIILGPVIVIWVISDKIKDRRFQNQKK